MVRQTKTLKTLIKLSAAEVDERRKALQVILDAIDKLEESRRQLVELKAQQDDFVTKNPDAPEGLGYGAWVRRWRGLLADVDAKIAAARVQESKARDLLHESFAQQKTFEISKDAIDTANALELDKREQKEVDEVQTSRRGNKS